VTGNLLAKSGGEEAAFSAARRKRSSEHQSLRIREAGQRRRAGDYQHPIREPLQHVKGSPLLNHQTGNYYT